MRRFRQASSAYNVQFEGQLAWFSQLLTAGNKTFLSHRLGIKAYPRRRRTPQGFSYAIPPRRLGVPPAPLDAATSQKPWPQLGYLDSRQHLEAKCRVRKPGVPSGPAHQQRLGPADNAANDAQLLDQPKYLMNRPEGRPASPTGRPGQRETMLVSDSDPPLRPETWPTPTSALRL
jgi:hypothetical protein